MDTSNSHFRVIDLMRDGTREEREVIVKAREVVSEILKQLKPIVRYITAPTPFVSECTMESSFLRAVSVAHLPFANLSVLAFLVIGADGELGFKTAWWCSNCRRAHLTEVAEHTQVWEHAYFEDLLTGLQKVFAEAKQKREEHLASIAQRSAMLDRVIEAMKGSS